ncbi:MAG: hypothetical protein JWN44_2951 [Myxococcales bacterium]|nr:hypothetical protein [Myxococcales bacterium]
MRREPFELSILGGATERAWRRERPDIAPLPWELLDEEPPAGALLETARRFWTRMAFQEHKTATATAATVQALCAARAPVDLIAHAARFVADELAHVELCARVAAGLGGAAPLSHDPDELVPAPSPRLSPLGRAAELVLRVYCIGEAFSLPLQQATARAQRHPLLSAILRRIARDESAHGAFGWLFFDWAGELVSDGERAHLRAIARDSVATVADSIEQPGEDAELTFGWLPRPKWQAVARRSLDEDVKEPLMARGLLMG